MTATATAFLAYANSSIASIATAHGGYGSRRLNGKPQRGPAWFDCIGWVRDCLVHVAPSLWPSNRGGEDSWTVPNFLHWWVHLSLGAILGPKTVPLPGDLLIFGAVPGGEDHIGIADGAGNCLSALDPHRGVCSVPIGRVGLPVTYVLRTGLTQGPTVPLPPPDPTPTPRPRTYTVKRGQNLSVIAALVGTDWRHLYATNVAVIGPNPNLIRAGQVLTIPGR